MMRANGIDVYVDLVENREADDTMIVLPHRSVTEARRLEHKAMTEIELVLDRWLEAIQVGNRLLQPAKRLAQASVDGLEALHVRVLMSRVARHLVLCAQLLEQRSRLVHTHLVSIKLMTAWPHCGSQLRACRSITPPWPPSVQMLTMHRRPAAPAASSFTA